MCVFPAFLMLYLSVKAFSVADPEVRRVLDPSVERLGHLFGGRLRETSLYRLDMCFGCGSSYFSNSFSTQLGKQRQEKGPEVKRLSPRLSDPLLLTFCAN
jgi:hypothetical protein